MCDIWLAIWALAYLNRKEFGKLCTAVKGIRHRMGKENEDQ